MSVDVIEIGDDSTTVISGAPILAQQLDDLTDVTGAATGAAGEVLTRANDGQWRPETGGGGTPGQVRISTVAAVAVSGHRAVTADPDGTVRYVSNASFADRHAPTWITMGAAAAGESIQVLAYGLLDEPTWSWTPGPIYLGTTGLLTQTPPVTPGAMFLITLGLATSPTTMFLDPRAPITLA
jgi:hypothetical protein